MRETPEPDDMQALVEALEVLKATESSDFDTDAMWKRLESRLSGLDESATFRSEGDPQP